MFTGLVSDLGTIEAVSAAKGGRTIEIRTAWDTGDLELGESVAVDGACLTVTEVTSHSFSVDASPETLQRTTLGERKAGDRVHLERALRLADRLGGHLVLGHVDGVGRVTARRPADNSIILEFEAPQQVTTYLIEKGSVTVDGVSLTVNECSAKRFAVAIIPFTAQETKLGDYRPGVLVNLEADIVGKYIHKFVAGTGGVDRDLLERHGFLRSDERSST